MHCLLDSPAHKHTLSSRYAAHRHELFREYLTHNHTYATSLLSFRLFFENSLLVIGTDRQPFQNKLHKAGVTMTL